MTGTREECVFGYRVLVIYTGGTIGMKCTDRGFAPAKGFLGEYMRSNPTFHDSSIEVESGMLVTPPSRYGKRTRYSIIEYDPLLDSSNIASPHWSQMAKDIQENYDQYDSFVILHGTDTMAYTASSLSFMLENLRKTVVVTGSQVPLSRPQTDGVENFLGALTIAGHFEIPEVLLYFNAKLMRGNRVTKTSSEEFDAFNSPNFSPLATVGTGIKIRSDAFLSVPTNAEFSVHTELCCDVACLRLYPDITSTVLNNFLAPPLKGVVLNSYGAGNGPDQNKEFLRILAEANERGVIIVNITQCAHGQVESAYAAGTALAEAGVISGFDMTVEAGLAKLAYLIGKGYSNEEIKERWLTPIVGEFTSPEGNVRFSFKRSDFIQGVAKALNYDGDNNAADGITKALAPVLLCSAAGNGDLKLLEDLCQNGISPNAQDYDGREALHIASADGKLEVVKFLLEKGANVNCCDKFGRFPINDAIDHHHHDVAKLLVANGGRLALAHPAAVLCEAAAANDVDKLKLFWECGFREFGTPDYDKRTALHVAACDGNVQVAEFLTSTCLDKAQWTMHDRWGNTPLDDAKRAGHQKIVELLSDGQASKRAKRK